MNLPLLARWGLFLPMLLAATGCGSSDLLNPLLAAVLDATDKAAFGRALRLHGPVNSGELDTLEDVMLTDSAVLRRVNAARLLTAARDSDSAVRTGIRKARDLAVWAVLVNSQLGLRPQLRSEQPDRKLAEARPEMVQAALASADPEATRAGLIAGRIAKVAGISAAGLAHLQDSDTDVQAAASAAIDESDFAPHLAELLPALETLECGEARRTLLGGLIRTRDTRVAPAAVRMLVKVRESDNSQYLTLLNSVSLFDKPDEAMEEFLFQVASAKGEISDFGLSALTTKVGWGRRKPGTKLMRLCVGIIERGYLGNGRQGRAHLEDNQQSCERMFYFLKTGRNPVEDEHQWRIESDGPQAIASAKAWLAANPSASTKALE